MFLFLFKAIKIFCDMGRPNDWGNTVLGNTLLSYHIYFQNALFAIHFAIEEKLDLVILFA